MVTVMFYLSCYEVMTWKPKHASSIKSHMLGLLCSNLGNCGGSMMQCIDVSSGRRAKLINRASTSADSVIGCRRLKTNGIHFFMVCHQKLLR